MLDKKIEYDRSIHISAYVSNIHEQPLHIHKDTLEIAVVLKGTVRAVVGYSNLLLKEGEVMIFNDKEIHGVYEGEEENLILTVHISNTYFKKYNETGYNSFFLMAATYLKGLRYDKPVIELRENLLYIAKAYMIHTISDEELEILVKELLTRLLDDFQYFHYSSSGGRHFFNRYEGKNHQAQAARMRELLYYLWENYNQKVTLQEYANVTHISMHYLSHIIKASTGLSFQELLNYTRVEMSERLLLETDKKISEIAFECGFSATRYYVKNFEKWFRVSPEEHRSKRLKLVTITYKEDILTGEDAIDVINEFSGQKNYITTGDSYFFTDILEIDVAKKSRVCKKRYNQLIKVNQNTNLPVEMALRQSKTQEEIIQKIKSSFRLCIPVVKESDFNIRVLAFLRENSAHSLLFSYDEDKHTIKEMENMISAFGKFCKTVGIASVNINIAVGGGSKARKAFAEKIIEESRLAGCRAVIKEAPQYSAGGEKGNYFMDSIYVVPWIIRSSLKSTGEQKFMNSLYDEDKYTGSLITGDSGIITSTGIKKPSFYAYMCLSMLGDQIIDNSETYIVTRRGEDIQILLYDYDKDVFDNLEALDYPDWDKIQTLRFATGKNIEYKLKLTGLTGRYNVSQICLDKEICLFNKLVDMRNPKTLSVEQENVIREFTRPMLKLSVLDGRKGTVDMYVKVPSYGASLLLLNKDIGI